MPEAKFTKRFTPAILHISNILNDDMPDTVGECLTPESLDHVHEKGMLQSLDAEADINLDKPAMAADLPVNIAEDPAQEVATLEDCQRILSESNEKCLETFRDGLHQRVRALSEGLADG